MLGSDSAWFLIVDTRRHVTDPWLSSGRKAVVLTDPSLYVVSMTILFSSHEATNLGA